MVLSPRGPNRYGLDMSRPVRSRVIAFLLSLVMSLGGIASAFAQRMPTVSDLAVVEAMAAGVTASDICGRDGKSLLAQAASHFCQTSGATILPETHPALAAISLRAETVAPGQRSFRVWRRPERSHPSRAPPQI